MDEPTTALDVVTQREILEELKELRDRLGFAVLFITHDLSLLIEIADSIAVMYAGRLVERASAERAVPRPAAPVHARAAQLVPAAARRADADDRHPRIAAGPARVPSGCVFHPRCRFAVDQCATRTSAVLRARARADAARRLLAAGRRQPVPAELALPEPGQGAGTSPRRHRA